MQRKWKKASAVALTGVLLASQALMVSAAGGEIDADMSTKTPILRVVVPTEMAVAVNEFEMGDNSQVTSGEFTMKNVSEIPVNVNVTSTATLNSVVTLVSTKKAAQDSTDAANPAMWLAAVAAVKDNGGTLEYVGGDATDKTVGALTGTEANATAFETKDSVSKAVQDFYLGAATSAQYKAIVGTDAEKIGEGADFYKLSPATYSDDAALNTALETQDVYKVTTAPTAGTAQTVTKIAKGTTSTKGTDSYYIMATAPENYATVKADSSGVYLYIDGATAPTGGGDAAAFRYAGALSTAKTGWSNTELVSVKIKYDITAVNTSVYDAMKGDLVYGYKGETSALSSMTVSAANRTLTVKEGVTVTKVTLVQATGNKIVATSGEHYTFSNGTLSLQAGMLSGNVGGSLEIEMKVGEKTKTETVTIE